MKVLLCRLFGFFKYLLLVISFGLVLYGIMATYSRLEKPLTDAGGVFIPFVLVLVVFIVNLFVKGKNVRENLFFNFVSCFVFVVSIIICLRAMLDKNMILFYKYQINFNPSFFADNLSAIEILLYMIAVSDIILIICDLISKEKTAKHVLGTKKDKEY